MDKQRPTPVGLAMKELGIQMIAAYPPQARGRSERVSGLAVAARAEAGWDRHGGGCQSFLRDRYIAEFNEKFTEVAKEKGTAFRKTSRADLDWIFTAQNERTVAKDNTVALGERIRQIEKTKFRNSLAGCVVTIHEHLDGRFSIRYGPHVVGRYGCDGTAVGNAERRGKAGPTAPTVLPLNNSKRPAAASQAALAPP